MAKVIVTLNYVNKHYLAAIVSRIHQKHESTSIPSKESLQKQHKTEFLRLVNALLLGYRNNEPQIIQQVCGPLDADARTDPKIVLYWEVDERMFQFLMSFRKKLHRIIVSGESLSRRERELIYGIAYVLQQLVRQTPAGKTGTIDIPKIKKAKKVFEEILDEGGC